MSNPWKKRIELCGGKTPVALTGDPVKDSEVKRAAFF